MENRETLSERLRSPDEETRRSAVVSLARLPLADVRDELFTAMGDASWRVRKEAVEAVVAGGAAPGIMEDLVGLLGSHDNAGLRNSAVEALERSGKLAVPVLCRYVGDDDHDVRKFVIDILGTIGDADAVPLLIAALDDDDPNVSAAAAENLGKIGDGEAVGPLVRSLAKPDIWFRYTVLESLGKIGMPVPIDVIRPLAAENLLKKAVYDCIGAIGDADAVPLLVEGLKERVKNSREAAAVALMKVRSRLSAVDGERLVDTPLAGLAGTPYVDGLLASVETSDRGVKESLVRILGAIGDERSGPCLLHGCRDERLRSHCLAAFEKMGDTGACYLLAAFPGADTEERCFIAYLCGELRYRGSASLLRSGMAGDSPLLRRVCAQAAGKIGLTDLVDDLVRLLDDSEQGVRESGVDALSRMADADRKRVQKVAADLACSDSAEKRRFAAILLAGLKDADRLSLLMKDEDAAVRKAAMNSLAELKTPAAVPHLIMALADEDADVRIASATALGEIGGEDVLTPLVLALKDEDLWVRCVALKSLGKLGDERAAPAIAEAFAQGEGLVLISALEALADIGGESVLKFLRQGLENSDEEVVKAAIELLSRRGDDWLDQYAGRLLSHPHWDVRRSFVTALAALRGVESLTLLRTALQTETDPLVREAITEIMGRFQ